MKTTKKAVVNEIQSNIKDWLGSIRYEKFDPALEFYLKKEEKYEELLTFSFENTPKKLWVSIQLFTRKFNIIENYWKEYMNNPIQLSSSRVKTIAGSHPNTINNIDWAGGAEQGMVERICEKVKTDYYTLVLPKLDEYSNIHKLDAIANGEDRTFSLGNSERYFRKLIIARLSGNPNYESIYEEMTGMYKKIILDEPTDGYYQNQLWVIEQLYEKLKNVQPLENPILI